MENELWHPLRDDPNQNFMVSNQGRVCNMITGDILEYEENILDGYLYVYLNDGRWAVHLLVADTFICCLDCDFWRVIHLDGDKYNNIERNLYLIIDEEELEYWRNNCE